MQADKRMNTHVKRVVKQHRLISHASKLDYLYLFLACSLFSLRSLLSPCFFSRVVSVVLCHLLPCARISALHIVLYTVLFHIQQKHAYVKLIVFSSSLSIHFDMCHICHNHFIVVSARLLSIQITKHVFSIKYSCLIWLCPVENLTYSLCLHEK